jgi:aspartyl-tRNA(Asn)/glutamyl-tRNA(Gln) amidotransferase subunit B
MKYEPVIGLEVHVQLNTKSKAFCSCSTDFGKEPNSQVCPVCLGFPGTLPVLNQVALDYAVKTGIALNCQIPEFTKFDRKNYFYPDLPKAYQISQYDMPLSNSGFLEIKIDNGIPKRIGITRVHLEEDAGKLIHKHDSSLVDFNRAGIPLLEIVSEPDINSPDEAYEYLTDLKSILEYLEISDCDMEKGSLRCDANISLRLKGTQALGTKTELKNMNSFKGVKEALEYEIIRQAEMLDSDKKIIQETRLWDAKALKSIPMRTKEEAQDYRYFPEPDLPPFFIQSKDIDRIRRGIPELPQQKILRFIREYSIIENDAKVLAMSKANAVYAEECLKAYQGINKKPIVNLLIGPLLSETNERNCLLADLGIPPENLVELVGFIDNDAISNLTAKLVLKEMIDTKTSAANIIKNKDLVQISDTGALDIQIQEVIRMNPKSVQDFKSGKTNAVMFLVGQLMKKTHGKANPKIVQELIKRRLEDV